MFCREKVSFAVEKYVLPWQMWATVSTQTFLRVRHAIIPPPRTFVGEE